MLNNVKYTAYYMPKLFFFILGLFVCLFFPIITHYWIIYCFIYGRRFLTVEYWQLDTILFLQLFNG